MGGMAGSGNPLGGTMSRNHQDGMTNARKIGRVKKEKILYISGV